MCIGTVALTVLIKTFRNTNISRDYSFSLLLFFPSLPFLPMAKSAVAAVALAAGFFHFIRKADVHVVKLLIC